MKNLRSYFFLILFMAFAFFANAQCSICTRTAEQMGEQPAKGLNAGIIYLALTPLAIIGIVGYKWWRKNRGPHVS